MSSCYAWVNSSFTKIRWFADNTGCIKAGVHIPKTATLRITSLDYPVLEILRFCPSLNTLCDITAIPSHCGITPTDICGEPCAHRQAMHVWTLLCYVSVRANRTEKSSSSYPGTSCNHLIFLPMSKESKMFTMNDSGKYLLLRRSLRYTRSGGPGAMTPVVIDLSPLLIETSYVSCSPTFYILALIFCPRCIEQFDNITQDQSSSAMIAHGTFLAHRRAMIIAKLDSKRHRSIALWHPEDAKIQSNLRSTSRLILWLDGNAIIEYAWICVNAV